MATMQVVLYQYSSTCSVCQLVYIHNFIRCTSLVHGMLQMQEKDGGSCTNCRDMKKFGGQGKRIVRHLGVE